MRGQQPVANSNEQNKNSQATGDGTESKHIFFFKKKEEASDGDLWGWEKKPQVFSVYYVTNRPKDHYHHKRNGVGAYDAHKNTCYPVYRSKLERVFLRHTHK